MLKLKEKNKTKQKSKTTKSRKKLLNEFLSLKELEDLKLNLGIIDTNGKILYVNKSLAKLLRYKPKEMIGSSFHKFVLNRDIQVTEKEIKSTLKTGLQIDIPSVLLDKKGVETPVHLTTSILKRFLNEKDCILVIASDYRRLKSKISKLKLSRLSLKTIINEKAHQIIEAHHQLQDINKKLQASEGKALDFYNESEEGETLKSILVADLSSQLKAPLTSIIGFVDIILNKLCHDRQRELDFVSDIKNYSDYILKLLEELLDLVRIEQGQMKLELEKIDLFEAYCNLENLFKTRNQNNKIELSFIFPYEPLPAVYVDKGKLKQIMINILNELANYALEGSIIVRVTPEYKHGVVLTQIESLRQKSPDEDSEKISKRLTRLIELKDAQNTLGLQMTKKLIQIMGGKLELEVTPDRRKMRLAFGVPIFGFKQETKPKLI